MKRNTIHRDGTVTYWSVYQQSWITHVNPCAIPDKEYAAMSAPERDRILAREVIAKCHGCGEALMRKDIRWENGSPYCAQCFAPEEANNG